MNGMSPGLGMRHRRYGTHKFRAALAAVVLMLAFGTAAGGGAWAAPPPKSVFACDKPETPALPDGATATPDEMAAAETAVAKYGHAFDRYLSCLGQLLNYNAGLDTRTDTNRWMTEAVREEARFLRRAGEERRKFQARNLGTKSKN